MARAQVAGRGMDPPGRRRCSESVRLHGEPRQQRRGDVDGSRRTEISAIHYPQMGKLLQKNASVRIGPGNLIIIIIEANSGYNSVFSFPGDSDSFSAILLTYTYIFKKKTRQDKHHSMQNPTADTNYALVSGFLSFPATRRPIPSNDAVYKNTSKTTFAIKAALERGPNDLPPVVH